MERTRTLALVGARRRTDLEDSVLGRATRGRSAATLLAPIAAITLAGGAIAMTDVAVAAPPKVKPAFAVTSVAKAGSSLLVQLTATVPLGSGTPSASDCSAKVTATATIGSKHPAGSGKLAPTAGGCQATITFHLPLARKGKNVSFRFSSKGTGAFAAFKSKQTLKLVTPTVVQSQPITTIPVGSQPLPGLNPTPTPTPEPTPTPTPTPTPGPGPGSSPNPFAAWGNWTTDVPTSGPYASQFTFHLDRDRQSTGLAQWGGTFRWECDHPGQPKPDLVAANFKFDHAFSVTTSNAVHVEDEYFDGNTHVSAVLNLTFNQSSAPSQAIGAITGDGNLYIHGSYDYGAGVGVKSCQATFAFPIYHYGQDGLT